jgi:hypothetical protein
MVSTQTMDQSRPERTVQRREAGAFKRQTRHVRKTARSLSQRKWCSYCLDRLMLKPRTNLPLVDLQELDLSSCRHPTARI